MPRSTWKLSRVPIEVDGESTRPPDWRDRAVNLLRVYNLCAGQICEQRGLPFFPKRTTTPDAVEIFWALERWCQERELDATTWIYVVHQAMKAQRPAKQGALFSEKLVARYREAHQDFNFASGSGLKNTVASAEVVKDVTAPSGAEVARRHYAVRNQAELCRVSIDITLGFDPGSPTCRACPAQIPCNRLRKEVTQ